jgi:hypothetical protein
LCIAAAATFRRHKKVPLQGKNVAEGRQFNYDCRDIRASGRKAVAVFGDSRCAAK